MRGKVCRFAVLIVALGITPAYAGKRIDSRKSRCRYRDHPRLCGEKNSDIITTQQTDRITPAYAGKRTSAEVASLKTEDHPRLCGEKTLFNDFLKVGVGSPPPMRGKEQVQK